MGKGLTVKNHHKFPSRRLLTAEEELDCIRKIKKGEEKESEMGKLIQTHLPIIEVIADLYSDNPQTHEELVQEGIEALIRAIDDYRTDIRFVSFAIKQVAGKMFNYATRDQRLFPYKKALREKIKLITENGGRVGEKELKKNLRIPSKEVDKDYLIALVEHLVAGDEILEAGLHGMADEGPSPYDQAELNIQLKLLRTGLSTLLGPFQRSVLELRYGLHGEEPLTQEKVAISLGKTVNQVQKLETDAINRLLEQGGLGGFTSD